MSEHGENVIFTGSSSPRPKDTQQQINQDITALKQLPRKSDNREITETDIKSPKMAWRMHWRRKQTQIGDPTKDVVAAARNVQSQENKTPFAIVDNWMKEDNKSAAINYLQHIIDKAETGSDTEKEEVGPYLKDAKNRLNQLQPPELTQTIPVGMRQRQETHAHGGTGQFGVKRGDLGPSDYPPLPSKPPAMQSPVYRGEPFKPIS